MMARAVSVTATGGECGTVMVSELADLFAATAAAVAAFRFVPPAALAEVMQNYF